MVWLLVPYASNNFTPYKYQNHATTPHSSKQFSLVYTSYVDGLTIAT